MNRRPRPLALACALGICTGASMLYALGVDAPAAPATAPASATQAVAAPAVERLGEIDVVGVRPGPRLWKVSRDGHVLWVLGTLNHLPRRMVWRSSEVEVALGESSQVLASGPDVSANVGPIAMIRLYFQWRHVQKDPDRTRLRDWLAPGLYARFEALKSRFDPHDSRIEELRPSFAALRIYRKAIAAAGLTVHDEAERSVLALSEQRHIRVKRAVLAVEDPSAALKEVDALSPAVETSCLESTVRRLETDLPAMQERARAWAVGDVERLRQLSFPDQREACMAALSNAPRIKALVERAGSVWDEAAAAALASEPVIFAMRPIYELLDPAGPLARLRAAGATVEGP